MSIQRTDKHKLNDASDALRKIRSLLLAAAHLNATDDETDIQSELYTLTEEVVNRALEAIQ
ncbi:MAG: hypothetical protein LKK36_09330 [Ewingella americana]|jgi:flagellin-like hook-associated protein FlgL|uniref:hypothetical protein n=1 Tax=Ewingella americana TaxID=41202 RepID=UPI00242E5F0B|nr:hypothetical protein [Ewingella americana]MCI1680466.1 hypothetical protein [Ewingella americana]MCI1856316.1 hypothetical protein [Ewingella americana]MCI1863967.1 hypothetical protein [Ewingella americana]MCI2142995.1 hypothetical protein [Ewingella americana]MCI2163880.1 hypothetical protein [Ewingella americana]